MRKTLLAAAPILMNRANSVLVPLPAIVPAEPVPVMSFEMLGSRYLNPYFGSSIYTWAALISTVLGALTTGYFLGGFIADRTVSAAVLGIIDGSRQGQAVRPQLDSIHLHLRTQK
jgi:hypothetical protein